MHMAKSQMSITVDPTLRDRFRETARRMGTNPTNLVNMFMAHAVATGEVKFSSVPGFGLDAEAFSAEELADVARRGAASAAEISKLVD